MNEQATDFRVGSRFRENATGHLWVYIGSRTTTVGTTERWWARFLEHRFGGEIRSYKCSKQETWQKKFTQEVN
jgi:hypothetical protein